MDRWITETVDAARLGGTQRYPLKYIEAVTDALPSDCYRVGEDVRAIKRDLGQRRAMSVQANPTAMNDFKDAFKNLTKVTKQSTDPVLRTAAHALQEYLQ